MFRFQTLSLTHWQAADADKKDDKKKKQHKTIELPVTSVFIRQTGAPQLTSWIESEVGSCIVDVAC